MSVTPAYLSHRRTLNCLCGNARGISIRRQDRYGLRFSYKFCLDCGHVRTSDPLSYESEKVFYNSSDYRKMYFPGESPSQVLHRKVSGQSDQSALLKYVERLHPEPGTILEWGCGGGWNLIPFRDAGWETLGFDYDATYISLGREYLGLNLMQITNGVDSSTIGSLPDVILLNHVLEHSSNPVELLQLLRDLSGPNTLIVVGVPLLETIRQWHWKDFFHVAHIHYFSADSLRKAAIRAGLRLVDESVAQGLFAFAVQGRSGDSSSGPRLIIVVKSAILLFWGWIDVEFRLRAFVRSILKATRLLGFARRLRAVAKR